MNRRAKSIAVLLAVASTQACAPEVSQPPEYVGRWTRLVPGDSVADTIELLPDGRVRGGKSSTTRDLTQWAVVRSAFGTGFCLGHVGKPNCQEARLEGDTLVVGLMSHATYWRRAH